MMFVQTQNGMPTWVIGNPTPPHYFKATATAQDAPVVKYKVSFFDRDGDSVCEDQEFDNLLAAKACAEDKLKEGTNRSYPPVKAVISQIFGTITVETQRTLSNWS